MGGLDQVVLDHCRDRKNPQLLHILYLDRLTNTTFSEQEDVSFSNQIFSRNLAEKPDYDDLENQDGLKKYRTILAELERLRRELDWDYIPREIGEGSYIEVRLKDPKHKAFLPREGAFVMRTDAIYTPTTRLMTKRELDWVRWALENHDYTEETNRYASPKEKTFTILSDKTSHVKIKLNPVTEHTYKHEIVPLIQSDKDLAGQFQIYTYYSDELFTTKEKAEAFKHQCMHQLNVTGRTFLFTSITKSVDEGGYKPVERHQVRCHSPIPWGTTNNPKVITQFKNLGFSDGGIRSAKSYQDMVQLDKQRTLDEIAYPAFHTKAGTPLSIDDIIQTADQILDHTAAVDLETFNYVKGKPGPSGMIVHAVLKSRREQLLFAVKGFAPDEETINTYRVVLCEDEYDLVRKLDDAGKNYAFLSCHNGAAFDWKHLRKFNTPRGPKAFAERIERLRGIYGRMEERLTKQGKQPGHSFDEWVTDEEITRDRVKELRKKHKAKGRPWREHRLIDTMLYAKQRTMNKGSAQLEALVGFEKTITYEEQDELFRNPTPENKSKASVYTVIDADSGWRITETTMPLMVWESVASGRALHRIAAASLYHNVEEERKKITLGKGMHKHGNERVRKNIEEAGLRAREALHASTNMRVLKKQQVAFYTDVPLVYNPLVLRSQRGFLRHKHKIVQLGEYLRHPSIKPTTKIIGMALAEHFLTPVLEPIFTVMEESDDVRAGQIRMFPDLTSKAFYKKLHQVTKYSPDRFLAAESRDKTFSLYEQYLKLQTVYHQLRDTHLAGQAGPFLIGEPGSSFSYYIIGRGNVALIGERMIAFVDGEPFFHGFRFTKKDNPVRLALIEAVRAGKPPVYETTNQSLQNVKERLTAALEPLPLFPHNL